MKILGDFELEKYGWNKHSRSFLSMMEAARRVAEEEQKNTLRQVVEEIEPVLIDGSIPPMKALSRLTVIMMELKKLAEE